MYDLTYLLIFDLQVSWKLYSQAFEALKIIAISSVWSGSSVPKPLLGWTSINYTREIRESETLEDRLGVHKFIWNIFTVF